MNIELIVRRMGADARWGTWLHKRLEGYKLDRELVGPLRLTFSRGNLAQTRQLA